MVLPFWYRLTWVQSAYRQGHSTETAVLKVISDIIDAAGLLDMSAAFDTVDHKFLLERLEVSFGVKGLVLAWLSSFLMDRTQVVAFGGNKSTSRRLLYGVPQGSVLGPLLFALYSADVIRIAAKHGIHPCLCGRRADLHQLRRI